MPVVPRETAQGTGRGMTSDQRNDGLGDWHTQPDGFTDWRWRDRFARLLGFHCWDCMFA